MARAVEHAGDNLVRLNPLRGRDRADIFGDRFVEVDHTGGIARPDRNLVHIGVGGVEQIALLGNRQHSQAVRPRLGADGGAFQRVERDIDPRPLARRVADLFADEQHRRLIALALADHDRAVHVQLVERGTHRLHRRRVRRLFIAAPDQLRRRNRRRLGHADHFKDEHAVERLAAFGHGNSDSIGLGGVRGLNATGP